MVSLALWDKSYEELASVLRQDNRCKEQQLHISGSNVKFLSNKQALTKKCQIRVYIFAFFITQLPFTCLLPVLLTPRSPVLLENITDSQVVKEFSAFYETRRLIKNLKLFPDVKFSNGRKPAEIH
jgi:hypothetical protein